MCGSYGPNKCSRPRTGILKWEVRISLVDVFFFFSQTRLFENSKLILLNTPSIFLNDFILKKMKNDLFQNFIKVSRVGKFSNLSLLRFTLFFPY